MDQLDALGDAELRSTVLFVRGQSRPVTADEVAEQLAAPRSVARWRLERLTDAGMLVSRFERRSGRSGPGAGRPAKTYSAATETAALEFPRRRYETLIGLLIGAVPARRRARELAQVGYEFGTELARAARLRRGTSLTRSLERLCRGLGRLGFQATLDSVSADEAVILSATCPLRPLLLTDAAARGIDEGMWCGLVAAVAAPADARPIVCRTHHCLDRAVPCRIVVAFASRT